MLQIAPCIKTMCSYNATSAPSTAGVSRSAKIVFDGRLPSNTRCGTSQSGSAFGFHLFRRFAERQRLGLRKHVRHQHVVMRPERRKRLRERNEIARNQPGALMDQLIKRVLAIGARLAPVNRAGRARHAFAVERRGFAVALHRQLLQVRREALQVLLVRQHRHALRAEEIRVPNRQATPSTPVSSSRTARPEMLVHRVKPVEHRPEILRPNRDHR